MSKVGADIAPNLSHRVSLGIATLALCATPAAALPQASAPSEAAPRTRTHLQAASATGGAVIHGFTLARSNQAIIINVKADGRVRATAGRLPSPERIFVDLEGAHYFGRTLRIPVQGGDVLEVRISQFRSNPAVTRIVIDVARPFTFDVVFFRTDLAIEVNTGPGSAVQSAASTPPHLPAALATPPIPPPPGPVPPSTAAKNMLPELQLGQLRSPISRLGSPEVSAMPLPEAGNLAHDEDGPTTAHQAAKANIPVSISGVAVSAQNGQVDVHIEASGRLRPTASVFSNPDRIVVDLANAYCDRARRIPVHKGDVKDIDVSLYLLNPPVTRIVLNLTRPHGYHLLSSRDSLTIRVDTHTKPVAPMRTPPRTVGLSRLFASYPPDSQLARNPQITADHQHKAHQHAFHEISIENREKVQSQSG